MCEKKHYFLLRTGFRQECKDSSWFKHPLWHQTETGSQDIEKTRGWVRIKHWVQFFPRCPSISIHHLEANTQTYADWSANRKTQFEIPIQASSQFYWNFHWYCFLFYSDPLKCLLLVWCIKIPTRGALLKKAWCKKYKNKMHLHDRIRI